MDLLSSVLRRPVASDDKYSRGVVGFVTGSTEFPGAAILGVTAAIRTGVGMVRWIGPEVVGRMLIEVRPETVLRNGRVQCWVLGSGVSGDVHGEQFDNVAKALAEPGFAVIDAGALDLANFKDLKCQAILTPHAGELERLLSRLAEPLSRAEIGSDPKSAAKLAARLTGQVVLLKGNVTTIADPDGGTWQTPPATPALATAGSGDVLGGVIGALVAANFGQLTSREIALSQIALAGALLHARAGAMAAQDGPVAALDIAEAVRTVVGEYLA
jgi:hydroxyethylthiazole kinase-like uncharacterized protein yjeF